MSAPPVGPDDVARAAERLRGRVRTTPHLELGAGEIAGVDLPVVLKLELLQHTGSFKARGAFNRVLTEQVPAAGLMAASGGNHGAALAFVGATLGHPTTIFVPASSPPLKAARIRALGANAVVGGARYDDAQATCDAEARRTGALVIHPYDHPATVAGAGTCARELEEQAGRLDTVLVATGGGGLTAGTAAWFAGRTKLVSVEPETSRSMAAALAAGRLVDVEVEGIAIDSLGTRRAGAVTFACARAYGVVPVTVPDAAIRAAQEALWQALRLVVEPGGAAALAALISGAYRPGAGERVGVVVCGANADPNDVTG